ncbi:MAG: isoleucine--tRNA ligase, partial [Elusimicrobia bacterium]|nr:isoleucine--tRNA ligase [Elusimicrobiota bacterium]
EGYIYRQKKPVYWCPNCETALADAEVEYADHTSHSIFVKFKISKLPKNASFSLDENPSVLIWTTTPWTLPANVALAFMPEADYCFTKIEFDGKEPEYLVLSQRLLPVVCEKIGAKKYEILNKFVGKDMEGIVCKNPVLERDSLGILADFVSFEDGTGVVHIAPGHGQDDYIAGLKYKLPIISPVDDKGAFTEEVKEFEGKKVFVANELIIAKLKEEKKILHEEKIVHSYPHCWRCKKPIIFRATPQWFMSVEHDDLRKKMLEKVKEVKWVPSYGEKRISGMLEVRPDWCLSRQRLWGVPIPVFYCDKCNEPILDDKLIDYVSKLFTEQGSNVWFEKSCSELTSIFKTKCVKCGSTDCRKEQDILDVWFDSGVSHEAVLASGNYPVLSWPADMYLEGSDQHRGWFQTSLLPAIALRKAPPYKTVLTHGFVVDGEGRKMSKSLGNVISPDDIIKKYGADVLRLWVATSDYREDIRISPEIINGLVDTYRKIRNTIRFLLGNLNDFSIPNALPYENLTEIDKFALDRLQDVILQVKDAYENYEFHKSSIAINTFCTVFLSGFYLDTLKDCLYCDSPSSLQRKSAQTTFLKISSVLIRLLSPILSFTSEEAWLELREKSDSFEQSVFLAPYPSFHREFDLHKSVEEKWDRLLDLREKALLAFENLRKEKIIGSNLEAALEISFTAEEEYLFANKEILPMVFGTWDITLLPSDKISETQIRANSKSSFKKCARCWRYIKDVSDEDLCPRCETVIGKKRT